MMKKTLAWILLCTTAAIFIFMISGCSKTWYERRDISKLHTLNYAYPNELAKDCAKWFPVKDSIGKPANPAKNIDYSGQVDSLKRFIDNLRRQPLPITSADTAKYLAVIAGLQDRITDLQKAYKPCKPDTIPHFIIDKALLNIMTEKYRGANDSLQSSKEQIIQLNTDKKSLAKWIWILGGILTAEVLGLIIFIIYKVYTGGVSSVAGNVIKKL